MIDILETNFFFFRTFQSIENILGIARDLDRFKSGREIH